MRRFANCSKRRSARRLGALGDLCGATIRHTAPQVVQGQPEQARQLFPAGQATRDKLVVLDFGGGLGGLAVLALPHDSCDTLTGLLGAQLQRLGAGELDSDALLGEIGNVLLNGVIGSIANTFGISIVAPCRSRERSERVGHSRFASVCQAESRARRVTFGDPLPCGRNRGRRCIGLLFDPASMMRVLIPRPAAV